MVMMMMMMTGCPHCTRPTDLGGLHSDDDDDVMMMIKEVSTLY